jgi:hypothetical protein
VSQSAADTMRWLRDLSEEERLAIGERARLRVLAAHTAAHRAHELETYIGEALERRVRDAA